MAEEYDDIPDSEKLKVATHFLLSSPPGEIKEILKDIKKVLPGHLINDGNLLPIFRTYNLDQFYIADVPGGEHKLVIFPQAEVDDTHYIDSVTQTVVEFNHISQECVSVGGAAPDAAGVAAPFRAAIAEKIAAYVKSQYGTGRTAYAVVANGDEISVVIAGLNTNLRNYWSGNWRSAWNIALKGDKATVTGSIKALVHYFEDGNVQMDTNKDVETVDLPYSDPESLATAVSGRIQEQEGSTQDGLERLYSNMTDETFKDMRRVLPVTRTKFDWSGTASRLAGSAGRR